MDLRTCKSLGCAAVVAALAMLVAGRPAAGQCAGSEPPSNFCGAPRILNGAPGTQTVIMNTSTATGLLPMSCSGPAVGHTAWFSITPTASGLLTFSTCHPSTTYDTVAEAFSGGDGECFGMTSVVCNDDTISSQCSNGCIAYGSRLAFDVVAGTQYRIVVGSYNNNITNCNLCLGVTVTLCSGDVTPPQVTISSPAALGCVCSPGVTIAGSVSDSGSGVASYELDYAPVSGGGWTTITRGVGAIAGPLGVWNTAALPDADYYLRLSAQDGCGNATSTVITSRVDTAIDLQQVRSPLAGAVLGGSVVVDGSNWDRCAPLQASVEWSRASGPPFWTSFTSVSAPWVINDPLGTWNSRLVQDGSYRVRVLGFTSCVLQHVESGSFVVDNTSPEAFITSPTNCERLTRGTLQVRGTVNDAHLASWSLQYTGGDTSGWTTIASGTMPVSNGVLANWNTAGLPWCQYTLRLIATDAAVIDGNSAVHNRTEHLTTVAIGCIADANGNGTISVQDIFVFLTAWFAGCP